MRHLRIALSLFINTSYPDEKLCKGTSFEEEAKMADYEYFTLNILYIFLNRGLPPPPIRTLWKTR